MQSVSDTARISFANDDFENSTKAGSTLLLVRSSESSSISSLHSTRNQARKSESIRTSSHSHQYWCPECKQESGRHIFRCRRVYRKVATMTTVLDWDTIFHPKWHCRMWMRSTDHRWTTMIHSIHSRAIRWSTIISLRLEFWRRNRNRIVAIQVNFSRKEFVRKIIQVTEDYFWRQMGQVMSSRVDRLVEWSDHDERSDLNECQSMCWEPVEDSQWDVFESIGRITDSDRLIINQQQQSANVSANETSVLRRHSVEIGSSKSSIYLIDRLILFQLISRRIWKERCHIPALFLFLDTSTRSRRREKHRKTTGWDYFTSRTILRSSLGRTSDPKRRSRWAWWWSFDWCTRSITIESYVSLDARTSNPNCWRSRSIISRQGTRSFYWIDGPLLSCRSVDGRATEQHSDELGEQIELVFRRFLASDLFDHWLFLCVFWQTKCGRKVLSSIVEWGFGRSDRLIAKKKWSLPRFSLEIELRMANKHNHRDTHSASSVLSDRT